MELWTQVSRAREAFGDDAGWKQKHGKSLGDRW